MDSHQMFYRRLVSLSRDGGTLPVVCAGFVSERGRAGGC
jgi:hypothetical protein